MAKKKAAVPEAGKNKIAVRRGGAHNSLGQGESTAQRKVINSISRQRNSGDDDTFGRTQRVSVIFSEATRVGNIGDQIKYIVNASTGTGLFQDRPALNGFLFYAILRDEDGNVIAETDQGTGGIVVEDPGQPTSDISITFDSILTADGISMLSDEELVVAYLTPKTVPVVPVRP
jgi:hypothetical protein